MALPWPATQPARGFGVELELLTLMEHDAAARSAAFRDALSRLQARHPEEAALLEGCAAWGLSEDPCIRKAPKEVAALHLIQEGRLRAMSSEAHARCVRLLSGCDAAADDDATVAAGGSDARAAPHLSEFQSPAPPANLRFSEGGAAAVDAFVRVLRCLGAGAPSFDGDYGSGTAVHVHVNCRRADAGGKPLTWEQLLCVWLGFVQFDTVLGGFTRPWFWREPSATALYATGAEFASTLSPARHPSRGVPRGALATDIHHASATAGGGDEALRRTRRSTSFGSPASRGAAGGASPPLARTAPGDEVATQTALDPARFGVDAAPPFRISKLHSLRWMLDAKGDVPRFVARVHLLLRERAFRTSSDETKFSRIFGGARGGLRCSLQSPGKYCALNLAPLTSYGTVEVRRYHGSLDGPAIASWAHLCVSCVDAFAENGEALRAAVFDAPLAEGLAALRTAQETATLDELLSRLEGRVSAEAANMLVRDSAGVV